MAYITYYSAAQTRGLYRLTQVVWYVFDVIALLLVFRFILKLLAANPGAGFTHFIYALSMPFVAPFLGVFSNSRVFSSTFEWPTLLAILVYWLLAWGVVRLVLMGKPMTVDEADYKLSRQDVVDEV